MKKKIEYQDFGGRILEVRYGNTVIYDNSLKAEHEKAERMGKRNLFAKEDPTPEAVKKALVQYKAAVHLYQMGLRPLIKKIAEAPNGTYPTFKKLIAMTSEDRDAVMENKYLELIEALDRSDFERTSEYLFCFFHKKTAQTYLNFQDLYLKITYEIPYEKWRKEQRKQRREEKKASVCIG